MKSLTDFINESLISETFQSDIIRNCLLGVRKHVRTSTRYFYDWSLAWDKITDADLKELTVEEATKRMRSKNNPGYIIWCSGEWQGHVSHCNVTYGTNIVLAYDGIVKGLTASAIAKSSEKAYEVVDPERFNTQEMRAARIESRKNALALTNYHDIRDANIKRYQVTLAKMRTPEVGDSLDKIKEMTEMYKNVLDKWVNRYMEEMQTGTPAYFIICNKLDKIHQVYSNMCKELARMVNYKDSSKYATWALNAYKDFSGYVGELESLIQDYLEESK